ncbi:hypothetical protein GVI76_19860 [Enterobacter hormaechei]|uniref:hypothetical protein n=1 Tax=Enterobacter hormaechei TaxID=158836 RepID=UPI0018D104BC|nr:hypothetical protein [Enterobacter hormaechei]QPO48919.1 hypothetical protein GVI76_19860 [Enterobacter hormaechei]QPO54189.1 hypothetical protein GVI75_19865 [Enterobacter hormaechei]UKK19681.1 hypothetical protein I9464_19870 [Enterobacter hormaechei]
MTRTELDSQLWELKCLLAQALIRRLKEDAAGESRMVGAELSVAVNLLKANAVEAPDTSFNRVFEDDEQ